MKLGTVALSLSLALGVAGSLALGGCSGQVEQTAPQTSASALSKAPVGANTHGFVKDVGDALGEVSLRPDQRAELEKIAQDAEARHVAIASDRKDLRKAVADQVEKGSIDRTALQPNLDKISADMDKTQPQDPAALVRIHDLLDADQRNAFADAMEQKFKGKHGDHKGMHGGGFARMKQLADDLKLTEEQRTQIKDVLKSAHAEHEKSGAGKGFRFREGHDGHERAKAAFEAFRSEKLDANSLPSGEHMKAVGKDMSGRMLGTIEKILPILTPEQRKLAADKIRQMADSGEMGPLGH
ncbi:hypothetical protein AKJ09_02739 [Labilithrix luteola]|uniref:Lipoprotein n=1 Tax=Labilithrix luteola TaxID=1391654 RepID=A0A0K1PRA6_9BACT|nr:Spy/CpxP family protein refolding chaperone [Labilithrix luteola]AKU96075.1 hypothetical protein AKJ09_02739 [Labilithrix luteola]